MREERYDESERLDEVIIKDAKVFHLERMDDDRFWIGIEHEDGSVTHLSVHSRSGRANVDAVVNWNM